MIKKSISIIALLGLFISISASAQDAKAKSLLDKVSANFKAANTMKANFSLSVYSATGEKTMNQNGTFYLKGKSYKIDMGKQQIICNGQTIWTYLVANKEVQISDYNPDEQTISPAKLFSGSYEKEYKFNYSGEQTISGKKVAVVTLTPIDATKSFNKVLLYVNQAKSMITGGKIFEKNGGAYLYSISDIKINAPISSSEFVFNVKQHPGVDVIDLR